MAAKGAAERQEAALAHLQEAGAGVFVEQREDLPQRQGFTLVEAHFTGSGEPVGRLFDGEVQGGGACAGDNLERFALRPQAARLGGIELFEQRQAILGLAQAQAPVAGASGVDAAQHGASVDERFGSGALRRHVAPGLHRGVVLHREHGGAAGPWAEVDG